MRIPQIKICGLTDISHAVKCAELGASAIGLVFYDKSPRNVSVETAAKIVAALPENVTPTGVFVDETYDSIMRKAEICNLRAVQLHGNEPPDIIPLLMRRGLSVIRVLYMESEPNVKDIEKYDPTAFLIECAKGGLPGGNALSWNFKSVQNIKTDKPLIIAGGLNENNIVNAVLSAQPDAVDVSSGVESRPGVKDIEKAASFIALVKQCDTGRNIRRIF